LKTILVSFAFVALAASAWSQAPCDKSATTILVVRHAERAGDADSISAAGEWRAKALANVALNAGVKAIYCSDTRRNALTAVPVATALSLKPTVYPAKETKVLVDRIFNLNEGSVVLVIGHSNTVDDIIADAGGPKLEDLPEDEYDRLFVVVVPPCRRGASTLVELQYGNQSPPPPVAAETKDQPQIPSVKLPPELQRVLTDYEAAWVKGDENELAKLFAEDGFILPSGAQPVRGRDAIAKHYQDAGGPLSLRALAYHTNGNTGYIIGAYGGAKDKPDSGKFTLTLRKDKDRRWLIMSDMDNTNRR